MATLAQTSGFFFCSAILKCARTWRKLRTQKPTEDEVEDDNDGNDKMPKRDRTRSGSKNYFLVTALSLSFFLAFSLSPLSLLLDFSSLSFTFLFLSLLSFSLYYFLVPFTLSFLSVFLSRIYLFLLLDSSSLSLVSSSLSCLFISLSFSMHFLPLSFFYLPIYVPPVTIHPAFVPFRSASTYLLKIIYLSPYFIPFKSFFFINSFFLCNFVCLFNSLFSICRSKSLFVLSTVELNKLSIYPFYH